MDSGGDLAATFLAIRPGLLRVLTARLGSRDEAEDALQDMWMRVDQLADRPVDQPASFLYRVAANLATDRRIGGARRQARDGAWADIQPQADEYADAERALIARDQMATVAATMDAMPERMRTALTLFRFEERPQRAIADQLGITVSGVEKLLKRAYRQLHDALHPIGADQDAPCRVEGEGSADP